MDLPRGFHEAYEVVKTLGVVTSEGHYRVELVRKLNASEPLTFLAFFYGEVEGAWRELEDPGVVTANDEESAVAQALGLLALHLDHDRPTLEPRA